MDLNQITIPCTDYAASVVFYKRLGLTQIVDSPPRYARFESATGTTMSLHNADEVPADGFVIYFEVPDVDAAVESLEQDGMKFEQLPTNQVWLWREAYLRDPSGNLVCIFHAGENRRNPPWRISDES